MNGNVKISFRSVAMHYIGCEMQNTDGVTWTLSATTFYAEMSGAKPFSECKPRLRKLEDMTDEDAKAIGFKNNNGMSTYVELYSSGDYGEMAWNAKDFHYLCQRGYDLFGLIDSGQAIDYKTVKK